MTAPTDINWTDRISQAQPAPLQQKGIPDNDTFEQGADHKALRARVIELEATVTRLIEVEASNHLTLTTLLGIIALMPSAVEDFEEALTNLNSPHDEHRLGVIDLLSEIKSMRKRFER